MTIRNMEKFASSIWDWGILDGCFGDTRIKPTDIDGCIERNGHSLFIETKGPGVPVPDGQVIMFRNWVKTGVISVLVIWGETNKPQEMMMYTFWGEKSKRPIDLDGLKKAVSSWYEWANQQRQPGHRTPTHSRNEPSTRKAKGP